METNFDRDFRAIVASMVSAGLDEDRIIEKAASLAGEMQKKREKIRLADAQRNALNGSPYSGLGLSGLNQQSHNPFGV